MVCCPWKMAELFCLKIPQLKVITKKYPQQEKKKCINV